MRDLINIFDRQFEQVHLRSLEIVTGIADRELFLKPNDGALTQSRAEYILRSAAKVEQTFGGITARLWDDPFEWTLPEELSTSRKIRGYLNEVEQTRVKGFKFFASDRDLRKEMHVPGKMTTVFELLLETLVVARKYQAFANLAKKNSRG